VRAEALAPAGPALELALASLGPADAEELAELFARNDVEDVVRQFHPFPLTRDVADRLAREPGRDRFYVARDGDRRLVALAMLRGWNEGYEVPSFGILVDRDRRGRGIGRLMTEHACAQAAALGCARIRLSVYSDNRPALALYRSFGFVEAGRERRGERDRVVMERSLDPPRIPVAAPALVGNELAYVRECLETTWISSAGEFIERFEHAFAEFCGARYAVACCNGTAALHLALLCAGIGPGDEVILPALTYVACANMVVACGATPILVDSEPGTWNLDPDAVAAAVSDRTRAILAVHLYGHPADVDALRAVANRHGLRLVEDAAEAHGAVYRGRPVGSLGDVGAFSFFGNKIVTTGEGGMVVTDDQEVAQRARLLRGQGQDPDRRYWHVVRGFNYRMTNVAAAIGVAQLERADWHLARRRELAAHYREALEPVAGVELAPQADWARPAHWMTCVRLTDGAPDRADVMRALDERGIETRPVFHPLHELPIYADAAAPGSFPIAEDLGARALCLPTSATFDRTVAERVALALQHALAR
jgi:perosamine synthetase